MTKTQKKNERKAREIVAWATKNGLKYNSSNHAVSLASTIVMAKWKDKEYKKRLEKMLEVAGGSEPEYTVIKHIMHELFGDDVEVDHSENDE